MPIQAQETAPAAETTFKEFPCAILRNTATGRFHSIPFRMYPHPADSQGGPCRYKSIGHHTAGFDTIELAKAETLAKPPFSLIDEIWDWDGVEIPTMVAWFKLLPTGEFEHVPLDIQVVIQGRE